MRVVGLNVSRVSHSSNNDSCMLSRITRLILSATMHILSSTACGAFHLGRGQSPSRCMLCRALVMCMRHHIHPCLELCKPKKVEKNRPCSQMIDSGEGHQTRRCRKPFDSSTRRVTYPESYITKNTTYSKMKLVGNRRFGRRIALQDEVASHSHALADWRARR